MVRSIVVVLAVMTAFAAANGQARQHFTVDKPAIRPLGTAKKAAARRALSRAKKTGRRPKGP